MIAMILGDSFPAVSDDSSVRTFNIQRQYIATEEFYTHVTHSYTFATLMGEKG